MKRKATQLFSQALAQAANEALSDWRKDHAPGASKEEILALHAQGIEVKGTIRAAGRVSIRVVVDAHHATAYEAYYFQAVIKGGVVQLRSLQA